MKDWNCAQKLLPGLLNLQVPFGFDIVSVWTKIYFNHDDDYNNLKNDDNDNGIDVGNDDHNDNDDYDDAVHVIASRLHLSWEVVSGISAKHGI